MSVSTDLSPFTHDPNFVHDSEPGFDDLLETAGESAVEDYQLIATRRAQLEDADTLRRMRAL